MIGILLGIFIPIGYILMGAVSFFLAFTAVSDKERRDYEAKKPSYYYTTDYSDAPLAGGLIGVFWPVGLPGLIAWKLATRTLDSDGMSSKQRAQIAYLREKAELEAKALATQKEWELLLAKEDRS